MPSFGTRSKSNLLQCHPDLQRLFNEVIKYWDCAVIEGHRSEEKQNEVFHAGKSKVQWPNSMHNKRPSLAADVIPWPVNWNSRAQFLSFGNFVKGVAAAKGIKIRWGGDFKSFFDGPHFELIGVKQDDIE